MIRNIYIYVLKEIKANILSHVYIHFIFYFTETPVEQTAPSSSQKREGLKLKRCKTIQTQWSTDDRFQCKICYENHVEVIFLPCRHVCCCQSCCNKLKVKECPICRSKIKGMQPLYFA